MLAFCNVSQFFTDQEYHKNKMEKTAVLYLAKVSAETFVFT